MAKKVFVSGCYDLLHSGHIEFFKEVGCDNYRIIAIFGDATRFGISLCQGV